MSTMSMSSELVEIQDCPICGSRSNEQFETLDERSATIAYRLCGNCGTVFQSPRMSATALDTYYESEYVVQHQHATGVTEKELRTQAGRARHLVGMLATELTAVERHLDIGCSTGSLMLAVQKAFLNEGVGIEPSEIYRAYCTARGLTVVPDLDSLPDGRFDLITMAHVVEHLPNPVKYLNELREERLNPDGTLMVEVPNLYGHRSVEIPHLFCFSAGTLRFALGRSGFQAIRMKRHGSPRSKVIPLYLTTIARPMAGIQFFKPSPKTVRIKRRLGMAWSNFASRIAPSLAWLPLPNLEGEVR